MGAMISGGGWSAAGAGLKAVQDSILLQYKMKLEEQDRQDRIKQEATRNALENDRLLADKKRIDLEGKRLEQQAKNEAFDRYASVSSRLAPGTVVPGDFGLGAIEAGLGPFYTPERATPVEPLEVAQPVTDVEQSALKSALERTNATLPKNERTDINAVMAGGPEGLQEGVVPGVVLGEEGPTGNFISNWGLSTEERLKLQDWQADQDETAWRHKEAAEDNRRAWASINDAIENRKLVREEAFNRDSQNLMSNARRLGLSTWRAQFPRQSGQSQDAVIAALLGDQATTGPANVDPQVAYGKLREHMRAALETSVKALKPGTRLAQFYTPEQIEGILDTITPGGVDDLREEELRRKYIDQGAPAVGKSTTAAPPPKGANPYSFGAKRGGG